MHSFGIYDKFNSNLADLCSVFFGLSFGEFGNWTIPGRKGRLAISDIRPFDIIGIPSWQDRRVRPRFSYRLIKKIFVSKEN